MKDEHHALDDYWYLDAPITLYTVSRNTGCKKRDEIIKQLEDKHIQCDLKEVNYDFVNWCLRTGQVDEFPVLVLESESAIVVLNATQAQEWIAKQESGKPTLYGDDLVHYSTFLLDRLGRK